MKNLEFTENKRLLPIDEPFRMAIESKKEENEINYYYKNSIVFLMKETKKGWTFNIWIMNVRTSVFFSREEYKLEYI